MPPTSWSELAGLRVGVWGLGVEGRATLRKLEALGHPTPVVVDENQPGCLNGPEGQRALAGCDVVIKSPGISRYDDEARSLVAQGVSLVGGLGLWLGDADRDRVACITGTKGKSTTTAVAGHLAAGLGRTVVIGGNIGVAPWDPDVPQQADLWLVETSSHQAMDVVLGPAVVAVTSLGEDHVDWHHGLDNYVRDKLALATRPGVHTVIADGASAPLVARADLLGPHIEWVQPDADVGWAEALGLIGAHNLRNAEVARRLLVALGVDAPIEAATVAAHGFSGLPSRLRSIAEIDGVEYVDDSLSTNVLPTLAAVAAFPGRRLALIVGGHDRGIDYTPLATGLTDRTGETLVLTLPENGPRIGALISATAGHEVVDCGDLEDAVGRATEWATPGTVILLAPAAPSFGAYRSYAERSADFARIVANL
jgi:UDP-N-acetylmuramoylalanine--D-glutamate ligase